MQRNKRTNGMPGRRSRLPGWLAGVFFLLLPKLVLAEGISGSVDLTYSQFKSSTTDASGASSSLQTRSFAQIYYLKMEKYILPTLRLSVGGTLQKNNADVILDDSRTTTTSLLTRPFVDLQLNTEVLSAAAGFSRVTNESTVSGVRGPTMLLDTTRGFLGWKPHELPLLDLSLIRVHSYDQDRAIQDVYTDTASLYSRYSPLKTLDLQYSGGVTDTRNKITDVETKTVSNGGRVMYNDRFFKDRVMFSAYYDVQYGTTEVTSRGTGTSLIPFQQIPFDGLYAGSNTPGTVQLTSMGFLINNVLNDTNNNFINIGSSPFTAPPPQDTSLRNIGLKFGVPTEMNRLLVWVYSGNDFLTPSVAGSYSWGIYTSQDGQKWSLYQTVIGAPYQPFPALTGVGNFEITFPNVSALYIKVVVSPLLPSGEGLLFPVVAVTELQAFVQKPASQVAGKTSGMTEQFTAYTKVSILEKPNTTVFYDFSYFTFDSRSGDSTSRRWTMTNALSTSHRFSRIVTGVARAERVDESDPVIGSALGYNYSAVLTAAPLPTLRDSLAYAYNVREATTGRMDTSSLFSNNSAELYTNVNVFLNAGWTLSHLESTQTVRGSTYSYGVGLAPHKTLSLALSATDEKNTTTGGGAEETTLVSRRQDAGLAYTPFTNLYLTAAASKVDQTGLHDRMTSYGVNWAPFTGGTLQFSFLYSETTRSLDDSRTTVVQPGVRWNIARWAALTASYAEEKGSSISGKSVSRSVTFNFRAII